MVVPWRALRCPLRPLDVQPVTQGVTALPLSGHVGALLGTSFTELPGRWC